MDSKNFSSFEKILLGIDQPELLETTVPLRSGDPCPQCGKLALDYNCLLQLACEICGFVSAEGGGCT